jgi:hypothetical protein
MPVEDKEMTRMVQREIGRRSVDASMVDVKVTHGVVFLRGTIRRLRGHDIDMKEELQIISRVLRQKQGIREVHTEDVVIR